MTGSEARSPTHGTRPRMAALAVAALGTLAALAMAPGVAPAQQPDGAAADGDLLTRADTVRLHRAASPTVLLTEFVDFACSECRNFHLQRSDSLQALIDEEDVVYAFRVFVIPRLLRGYHGAEAAFCAGAVAGRDGFRRMRDVLFERQADWATVRDTEPLIRSYAVELGLPADEFHDCVRRNAMAPLIVSDMRQGVSMGIPGTPTFLFTRVDEEAEPHAFYGNQPMSEFRAMIRRVRGDH